MPPQKNKSFQLLDCFDFSAIGTKQKLRKTVQKLFQTCVESHQPQFRFHGQHQPPLGPPPPLLLVKHAVRSSLLHPPAQCPAAAAAVQVAMGGRSGGQRQEKICDATRRVLLSLFVSCLLALFASFCFFSFFSVRAAASARCFLLAMARNEEKAQSMLNRWVKVTRLCL